MLDWRMVWLDDDAALRGRESTCGPPGRRARCRRGISFLRSRSPPGPRRVVSCRVTAYAWSWRRAYSDSPAIFVAGAFIQAGSFQGAMPDYLNFVDAANRVVDEHVAVSRRAAAGGGGGYLYPRCSPGSSRRSSGAVTGRSGGVHGARRRRHRARKLLLLGVRDWRCHGAALLGAPVPLAATGDGRSVAPLGDRRCVATSRAVSAVWRWVGLVVAVKPFLSRF